MIITVTINPAMDKTTRLEQLEVGQLNRLDNIIIDAGGKGINVSKVVSSLGGNTVATGFVGGYTGEIVSSTLKDLGIKNDFVNTQSITRTNLKIIDDTGQLTELNEVGSVITGEEIDQLKEKISFYANSSSIVVFGGSLPKGVSTSIYSELIELVHDKGGIAYLDADGAAFENGLAAKPDFIKPNKFELMQYFKKTGNLSLPELAALCRQLINNGIPKVALSMGKDGALFVDANSALYARGLNVASFSPVGAGDSMVGAIAFASRSLLNWEDSIKLAVATSAGAVTTEGTKPPTKQLINQLLKQVELEEVK